MKKVLFGVAFAFSALCSQASYLYWQVSSADLQQVGVAGNWADLYVTGGGESTWLQKAQIDNQASIDVSSYADGSYSFYVEIVNYENNVATVTGSSSNPTSYGALAANHSIIGTALDTPMVSAWHGGNLAAAPEPTSGFLMMVGLALLGLKRRKA